MPLVAFTVAFEKVLEFRVAFVVFDDVCPVLFDAVTKAIVISANVMKRGSIFDN